MGVYCNSDAGGWKKHADWMGCLPAFGVFLVLVEFTSSELCGQQEGLMYNITIPGSFSIHISIIIPIWFHVQFFIVIAFLPPSSSSPPLIFLLFYESISSPSPSPSSPVEPSQVTQASSISHRTTGLKQSIIAASAPFPFPAPLQRTL